MTRDPHRLRDEGTPSERDLLSSAREDAPSAEAERRARVALGLAAPLMPLPGPETAAPAAAPASVAGAKAAGLLSTAKLAAITSAVATLATASWLATRDVSPAAPAQRPAPPPVSIPVPVPVPVPISSSSLPVSVPVPVPVPRPRSKPLAPPPPALSPTTLERELELLRAARAHLAVSDPMAAEATLAQLRREIPNGELHEESAALALETAFALRLPDAAARAEAFLAEFPGSPHASRARALLAEPEPPQ